MKTKTIAYGTTVNVTVLEASKLLITCFDENKEGYMLMNHGVEDIPQPYSKGKIVFTKHDGPTRGYWKFTPITPKP